MVTRYRHSHLKHLPLISDGDFDIRPRWSNAILNGGGVGYAHFVLDHSGGSGEFQVRVFANATDAQALTNEIAESAILDTSTLPATVELAEANSSGVTGSVLVRGVN